MYSLKTSPGYMGSKDFENMKYIRSVYLNGSDPNTEETSGSSRFFRSFRCNKALLGLGSKVFQKI